MSTIEIEKVEKSIDDVYNDIPCEYDDCHSGKPGKYGVVWVSDDGSCHKEGGRWIYCEDCTKYSGPCRVGCGAVGRYVVVI